MLVILSPDVFYITRIILFFFATWFIYKALQAIDFSKIFKRNSGDQIRFLLMIVSVILGFLFVDAIISLFEYLNNLF